MVVGKVFEEAASKSVGELVLASVRASRGVTRSNANLGIILLLAPLAKGTMLTSARVTLPSLREGVVEVLGSLSADDSRQVYAAIREASPGGLGVTESHDVHHEAPLDLLEGMAHAAPRDRIARCYVTGFADLFEVVVPTIINERERQATWSETLRWSQISLLSQFPDSLIGRKCGEAVALEVQQRAAAIVDMCGPAREEAWRDFDRFLRQDGHRLNPGTTADLLAAGMFGILVTDVVPHSCPHERKVGEHASW